MRPGVTCGARSTTSGPCLPALGEGGLSKVKTSAAQGGPSVFVLPQGPTHNSWFLFPQAPFPSLGTPLPSSLHLLQTQHVTVFTGDSCSCVASCPVSWLEFPPSDGHPYCVSFLQIF